MSDEFDDELQIGVMRYSPTAATMATGRQRSRVAGLAPRLHSESGAPTRARMRAGLLRPFG
ncbi:MAG: hypothetical protein Q7U26_07620 [Aquabacterium sp.]|nr:hypothetical protein [Aquabacterium sp.]